MHIAVSLHALHDYAVSRSDWILKEIFDVGEDNSVQILKFLGDLNLCRCVEHVP